MRNFSILFIINTFALVTSQPVNQQGSDVFINSSELTTDSNITDDFKTSDGDGEIISVRITSSVAVGRRPSKANIQTPIVYNDEFENDTSSNEKQWSTSNPSHVAASEKILATELPPDLAGANIEFIKQLNAKKEARALELAQDEESNYQEQHHSPRTVSSKPLDDNLEDENVPIARSIPFSSLHYPNRILGRNYKRRNNSKVTSVSFNIVHDNFPSSTPDNEQATSHSHHNEHKAIVPQLPQQPTIYSEPAKIYSEPAKIYSEPAKVYSEPAKVYGEPAKVYSEPAKIYSEPAKFYSQPASLHLDTHKTDLVKATTTTTTEATTTELITTTEPKLIVESIPEENYEIDEKLSIVTDGRSHGVQDIKTTTENNKIGYVVEGKQYRKYRVEERTAEGFIVGEYGVVRNEDGALRGVRYTADGEASPRLIYDALMKFLQL